MTTQPVAKKAVVNVGGKAVIIFQVDLIIAARVQLEAPKSNALAMKKLVASSRVYILLH